MILSRRDFLTAMVAEVLTIPKESMPRAEAEVQLMDALRQDVHNLHSGMVDWKLRKRIQHLIAVLSREI